MTKKIEAYEGSGNVFADLGLPNPEERLLKANIVAQLHRLIKQRGLTQVKAAKLLGITQPDLSHLLHPGSRAASPSSRWLRKYPRLNTRESHRKGALSSHEGLKPKGKAASRVNYEMGRGPLPMDR